MRRIQILLLATIVLLAGHGQSDARRFTVPFYIAGFTTSEEIVKVLDLPDTPSLRSRDDRHVDLGWLWKRDGSGEWVGYVGSPTEYVPMKAEHLPIVMQIAGLSALPPVPERAPAQASADASDGGLWLLAAGLSVFALFWMWSKRTLRRVQQTVEPETGAGDGELTGWAARASESLAASGLAEGASMGKARGPMPPKEQLAPIDQLSHQPAPAARRGAITAGALAVHSARPAFGRR